MPTTEEMVEEKSQDTTQSQDVDKAEEKSQDAKPAEDKYVHAHMHERAIQNKDKEIARLKEQLEQMTSTSKTGEDRIAELEKNLKELTQNLEEEKVSGKLTGEGCIDIKAAKARLDEFNGDVVELKKNCPYLFKQDKQQGITGGKPQSSVTMNDNLKKAYAAAGLTYPDD